ncbi:Mitogen-activated protein kinase kinase kinase 1 [Perkinsus chesapeaki]|uniref:Mitogen-activated protein kinase kinase kinase 1 n=1 Tax=Perkinsus chesapeaki TaxID=330153 RepID=A0A7J6N2Y8_PERCH|nr:Mitogen-activated protein kinase kinase kinase 1 [Perkinsus chesapeaki]
MSAPHPYASDEVPSLDTTRRRRSPRRSHTYSGRRCRSDSQSASPVRKAALKTSRSNPTSVLAEFGRYCSGQDVYQLGSPSRSTSCSSSSSSGYSLIRQMAQGSEGDVYVAARPSEPSERLCIKIIKLRSAAVKRHARQELAVLFGLMKRQKEEQGGEPEKITNLVRASDWFLSPTHQEIGIVMEKCDFCLDDLICVANAASERLSRDNAFCTSPSVKQLKLNAPSWRVRLHPNEVVRIFEHACKALAYLHANRLVHCDVKLDNLVYHSASKSWKLCDFGSSRFIPEGWDAIKSSDRLVGTLWTAAPEVIRYGYVSPSCDVWSLGCVLWECGYLERPFNSRILLAYQNKSVDALEAPSWRPGCPTWIYGKALLALVKEGMLVQEQEARMNIGGLLLAGMKPPSRGVPRGVPLVTADDFTSVWYADRSSYNNSVVWRLIELIRANRIDREEGRTADCLNAEDSPSVLLPCLPPDLR